MPAGIVLGGGRGTRLGQPKATVVLDGSTLVERAVAMLRDAGCEPVVVVARDDTELPPLTVEVVRDPPGDAGPLAALIVALEAVDADEVVVLACDLPNAAPAVARLLQQRGTRVSVDPADRIQPLCAQYVRQPALDAARAAVAAGDLRVTAWCESLAPDRQPATDGELANINTPDDLSDVRRGGR